MQTMTATMTTRELVNLDIAIGHAMNRAGKVGNVEVMKSLLRDRRRVRNELEGRKAAESN